ncbi:MAG: DeoR/GlpR family DNA-binding transcription regulator, partial [Oscillospiraceae bacterium]
MKQGEFMFAELRKQEIVNIVQAGGKTTVGELCAHFSVSPATIRNDLSELEQIGSLKRTHGGAICNDNAANYEPTSCEKEVQNVDSKKAIAMAAIKFVHQGDIIALDTGTTTLEFAMRLATLSGLTIITTDLKIATYLEQNSDHTVILIGGV